ncbi:unnamed protein product [Symbiodinium natans]|uniref:Uncharacterized protein n=1 Tax=Symbiodinium natans TaxID=878477 RepID=A0A812LWE4_9DINO|nr:unnamed protein product [Symbiodinium natans]
MPDVHHLKRLVQLTPVTLDFCRYGANYRKRTTIYVSDASMLSDLEKKCNHRRQHRRLGAWRDRKNKKGNFPEAKATKAKKIQVQHQATKEATAYPIELCESWATCVAQHIQ